MEVQFFSYKCNEGGTRADCSVFTNEYKAVDKTLFTMKFSHCPTDKLIKSVTQSIRHASLQRILQEAKCTGKLLALMINQEQRLVKIWILNSSLEENV